MPVSEQTQRYYDLADWAERFRKLGFPTIHYVNRPGYLRIFDKDSAHHGQTHPHFRVETTTQAAALYNELWMAQEQSFLRL